MSKLIMFLLVLLALAILFTPKENPPALGSAEYTAQKEKELKTFVMWQGKESVLKILKDKDSAQFDELKVHDKFLCGKVNSKNSFGGYAGFSRFISGATVATTDIEQVGSDNRFQQAWELFCTK